MDVFIKVDRIGARIIMLDFKIAVWILSQPTLFLCLRLITILVISGMNDG